MSHFRTLSAVEGCGRRPDDRAAVVEHPAGLLLAIADGAGGTSGGGPAADAVTIRARQWLEHAKRAQAADTWAEFLRTLDGEILRGGTGGETTAVVLMLTPEGITGASVGDSAAWLISSKGCTDLTHHQCRKPLIGSGQAIPIPFEAPPLDGALLLATDGLIKYARADRICDVVRDSAWEDAPGRLINLVRLRSGALQDDVGLILCTPASTDG